MSNISINLLPIESTEIRTENQRRKFIQTISIVSLLTLFFLASLIVTLRILQSQNLKNITAKSLEQENKISSLRDKESTLVLLKDRLNLISKITANPSKQKQIYNLIVNEIPTTINVSSLSLDGSSNLSINAVASDSNALNSLFLALASDQTFKEISGVSVESLSRGRDGLFRVSLKLIAKQ